MTGVETDPRPVGPVQDDACKRCKRPQAEHRSGFMDLRDDVVAHDYEQPALRPYDHEVVPAMITTEWHCHRCHQHNDVWGDGAMDGYMECGHCGAYSWLVFDPPGFGAQP
jgi:hypothetical protein